MYHPYDGPMKPLSPEAQQHCLDTAETITLSTVNPNGTVHSVPVWYRYDGEAFWVITGTDQRKTRNLRRDPRASLLLLVERTPERPTEIALVYGTTTVHELAPAELRQRARWMWSRYVDEDIDSYVDAVSDGSWCALEIRPDKIVGWHPA